MFPRVSGREGSSRINEWGIIMGSIRHFLSWGHALRMLIVAALFLSVSSLSSLSSPPTAEALSRPELVFTLNGERVDAKTLDGAVIPAGSNLAVWIAPRYHPAKRVEFYLNGEHVQTEDRAPWDLSGTGWLNTPKSLWSSDLPEGRNVVEARIDGWFNRDSTLTATFDRAPASSDNGSLGLDFTETEQILDDIVRDEDLNGAGLVVVHPDHGIVHESYRGEIAPDRISLIASTGKVISSGVLLHLADEGLLDMDAPISEAVGWGASLPGVTPAQLLSNSSGLPDIALGYVANLCTFNPLDDLSRCGRASATNRGDDWLQIAPDTEYRYGGPQWQVAGALAEEVSGKSWAELINEIYVEPCGLDTLEFTNFGQPHLLASAAVSGVLELSAYPDGFNGDPSVLIPSDNPMIEGGGYTTPHDYAELLLMLLRGGSCGNTQVLSQGAIDQMTTDRIGPAYNGTTQSGVGYGLGWTVDGSLRTDPGFFGAVSWLDLDDGYGAYFVIEDVALPGKGDRGELIDSVDRAMSPLFSTVTLRPARRLSLD